MSSTYYQDLAAQLAAGHSPKATAERASADVRKRQSDSQLEIHAFETQAVKIHEKKKAKQEPKSKKPGQRKRQ